MQHLAEMSALEPEMDVREFGPSKPVTSWAYFAMKRCLYEHSLLTVCLTHSLETYLSQEYRILDKRPLLAVTQHCIVDNTELMSVELLAAMGRLQSYREDFYRCLLSHPALLQREMANRAACYVDRPGVQALKEAMAEKTA